MKASHFCLAIMVPFASLCTAAPDFSSKLSLKNDLISLSHSGDTASVVLLRQFLFSPDTSIRRLADSLLSFLNDNESFVIRQFAAKKRNSKIPWQSLSISSFIPNDANPAAYVRGLEYAALYCFRDEVPHIGFLRDLFDSVAVARLHWKKEDCFFYELDRAIPDAGTNHSSTPSIIAEKRFRFNALNRSGKKEGTLYFFEDTMTSIKDTLYFPNGIINSWIQVLSKYSTRPFVSDGCIYIGDGTGAIRCLNAANGSQVWVLPIPLPIFALFRDRDADVIETYFPVSVTSNLVIGFDRKKGPYKYCSLQSIDTSGMYEKPERGDYHRLRKPEIKSVTAGNYTFEWRKDTDSSFLSCRQNNVQSWKIRFDPVLAFAEPFNDRVIVAGEWDFSNYGIASLSLKDGSIQWTNYLELSDDLAGVQKANDTLILAYSNESEIILLNARTGSIVFKKRFAPVQHYSGLTKMQIDYPRDRIVVHPSNGLLYSFPISILASQHEFRETRPRFRFEYPDIFTSNAYVGTLDTNIKNENDLFNLFGNRFLDTKYAHLRTADSSKLWDEFSGKLVAEAKLKGHDTLFLKNVLHGMKPAKTRILVPISAFYFNYKGQKAVAICCLWGHDMRHDLGHLNVTVFSLKTGKFLGYNTCM